MIVTPVSAGDIIKVRYPYSRVSSPLLNIFPLTVSATALVNEPSGITYPTGVINVDSTSAGWNTSGAGRYVRITSPDGTVRKYTGYTRLPTSTTLRINGINSGDTGQAQETAIAIANNDLVTVYTAVVPGATRSRIDPDTDEILKRWDVEYNDQTIDPQPRVIRGGNAAQIVNPATGVATFELDASDSVAWAGHSVTYQWTFPDGGVTITVGTDTDPTITVEVDPGARLINLVVTDTTTSRLQGTSRILYAVDNDTFKAFNQLYNVSAFTQDFSDRTGWVFSFTVSGTAGTLPTEDNYLYIGASVTLSYNWEFSADGVTWVTLDDPDGTRNFNGFIQSWSDVTTNEDGVSSITVQVVSLTHYFAQLPLAIQALTEKTTPVNWTEVDVDLNNTLYYIYYLLDEHSVSLARLADVRDDDDFEDFRRASMKCDAPNFLQGLQSIAALVPGGNIGALSYGAITLRRNISLQDDTYRATTDNRYTFSEPDFVSENDQTPAAIRYNRNPLMRLASLQGGGFVWNALNDTAGYLARAGLLAPMQGTQPDTMPDFIAGSLADVQRVVGHEMAYRNRPTESLELPIRCDLVEPARLEPVLLDMATHDPLDSGLWDNRAVPLRVERRWGDLTTAEPPRITLFVEPVTYGQPAPQYIPDAIGSIYVPPTAPACPTLNITWASTGATPSGWSGLSGQDPFDPGTLAGFTPGAGTINQWAASRSSMANWTAPNIPEAFGVMYEFAAACTLSHIQATFTWSATSNTKVVHFLALVNGVWTDLLYETYAPGFGVSGATVTWTGSPVIATKLIYAAAHGSASATINMTISKINSP